jgi:hypothetical protein
MRPCVIALSVLVFTQSFFAVRVIAAPSPGREMADAANHFLASLTPEQKAKATYEFKDDERFDWHFIPKPRKGLPFKEMTSPQRLLGQALLNTGLSHRGYMKATAIMSLEQILYEVENRSPTRDADLYFVTIFGTPGANNWAWRVEGHHLSLNFALNAENVLAVTPLFFGANPAEIKSGPRKGLRVLGGEEDLGRTLVNSLDDSQRQVAIITNVAPRDIITANNRKTKGLEPMGIESSKLSAEQKQMLLAVIREYLFRSRPEIADPALKAIQDAGPDQLHFAWAGGLQPGQGHYYRVQGPTFLLEYDNTQDGANHIHSVWRDLQNDFGEDLLRKHYEEVPHGK